MDITEAWNIARDKKGGSSAIGVIAENVLNQTRSDPGAFIRQLYFPEFNPPAAMPTGYQGITVPVQLEDTFSIDPTPDGNFALYFDPEAISPRPGVNSACLGVWGEGGYVTEDMWVSAASAKAGQTSKGASMCDFIKTSDRICEIHEKYRLTGAVVLVEYMGPIDEHSGYIACALVSNARKAFPYTLKKIQEGEYVQEVHPIEGVRGLWLPKRFSDDDFKFPGGMPAYPSMAQAISAIAAAGYDVSTGKFVGSVKTLSNTHTLESGLQEAAAMFDHGPEAMELFWHDPQKSCILMFGTGLPTTRGSKFKGRIIRNFECVPKQEYVNYTGGGFPPNNIKAAEMFAALVAQMPEFGTMPLHMAGNFQNVFERKLDRITQGIQSMRAIGNTIVSATGATYRRGLTTYDGLLQFIDRL